MLTPLPPCNRPLLNIIHLDFLKFTHTARNLTEEISLKVRVNWYCQRVVCDFSGARQVYTSRGQTCRPGAYASPCLFLKPLWGPRRTVMHCKIVRCCITTQGNGAKFSRALKEQLCSLVRCTMCSTDLNVLTMQKLCHVQEFLPRAAAYFSLHYYYLSVVWWCWSVAQLWII